MSRTKKIAVLAIIAMVLTMLPIQLFAATTSGESTRLFGAGRVETALAVADAGWTSASTVVVAAADQANLVDALAAAPLAGQENAPILLTFKDKLDPTVKAKIAALGATKVYVVGAVTDAVAAEIDAITGVTVEALKGSSRWDTTKAINAKLTSPAGTFVVGYAALADALSVSSFAAKNKYAIVLADVNGMIPAGQAAVGTKTYLVGGSTLVADIAGATRLAGADRFATNVEVLKTLSFDYNKVYVANGMNEHLVDSLVAAPLAAKNSAAIVLSGDSAVGAAADYVNGKLTATSTVIALGGTGVVSDAVRDGVKYNTPATFAVEGIETLGLNAFKVTFNQAVDEDTAEMVTSYKVDGSALATSEDKAVLQSDGKTVLVMVSPAASKLASFDQNQSVLVEVKGNVIYNDAKGASAATFTKEVKFSDVTAPTIDKITAVGNKVLKVYFTEPVSVKNIDSKIIDWTIDGQKISSMGVNASFSNPQDATTSATVEFAYQMELVFETAISAGSHSLTVNKGVSGTSGVLVDGANFVFQKESKDFTIESKTDAPVIKSVIIDGSKVKVEFDRAMYKDPANPNTGSNSALTKANYNLNDAGTNTESLSDNPTFKTGSGNKIVQLPVQTSKIKKGVNVLEIDKDIKDSWGNKLSAGDDNIRVSFTYQEDSTEPTVLSVAVVGEDKLRINFSKDMDEDFAEDETNYTIKNSDGERLATDKYTANTIPSGDSDTVEISLAASAPWKFNRTGYSLKVEDLRDTALSANVMDDYTTTFDGIDETKPTFDSAVVKDADEVILFFSEKLDSAKVVPENFSYLGGDLDYRNLPAGTTVSLDGTGKIVTVDFPTAYTVTDATTGLDKYYVEAIVAANLTDVEGNVLAGVAKEQDIKATVPPAYLPKLVANSFVLYDDGTDIKAEFEMSQEIGTVNVADFKITTATTAATGIAPTTGYSSGKKVVLTFASNDTLRSYAKNAYIVTTSGTSDTKSTVGVSLATNESQNVYDEQVKPRLLLTGNPAVPSVTVTTEAVSTTTKAVVNISFTEAIDGSIVGNYEDDFMFSTASAGVDVSSVSVSGNVVSFHLDLDYGTPVALVVKADADKISIRDLKDNGKEDYNLYVPKTDDKDGFNIAANGTVTW